jgi:hypothetical protein
MLSKKVLLFGLLCCAVIAINARAFSDDMEVAASGKDEEWKKGGGKDHFEEEKSSHGDKGENRFVLHVFKTHFVLEINLNT